MLTAFVAVTALATVAVRQADAAPVVGDTFVYRVINGYNNEERGQVSYRVDSADPQRIVMSVSSDNPGLQLARTLVFTAEGNWLRHPVINHDRAVDYEFSQAYPAYDLPLDQGKQWSNRVNAVNPASGKTHSVRVDATVIGAERIRVPAGEYETIKIKREVYAGDTDYNLRETNIVEMDWYAPALGRSVRVARSSAYIDQSRGRRNQLVRGDWDIFELVSAPAGR